MKISKIRNTLNAQLLFLGFIRCDNSNKYWSESEKRINNINFTIAVHNSKTIMSSVRVYAEIYAPGSFTQKDFALNKNTFNNMTNYIGKYEHPKN